MCITINNNAPHLKSPKNQNRKAALGRPAMKFNGRLELVSSRPTLALSYAVVHQRNRKTTTINKNKTNKTQAKRKAGSWIERQLATMLESHARQTQQQRNEQWEKNNKKKKQQKKKQNKKKTRGGKSEVPPWDGQQ